MGFCYNIIDDDDDDDDGGGGDVDNIGVARISSGSYTFFPQKTDDLFVVFLNTQA